MPRVNFRSTRLKALIDAILAEPERARYWAEHCAWVPGTGDCIRPSGCAPACWLRPQREEERREMQQQQE